jgi:uncharacterized protein YbbC (DUF1343 family)/CubicO group peptidase (beta-lactamase class C family)
LLRNWAWLALAFALVTGDPVSALGRQGSPEVALRLQGIGEVVQEEIGAGHIPGAVVVVGLGGRVVYRQAFGRQALLPRPVPMTLDTIFDLASLTKVIATTTAILQLKERGRLDLDKPVAAYWPAFAANGKERITIRELLTHYSALPPDLPTTGWSGYKEALRQIESVRLAAPHGSTFVYSDIDFAALGELVRRRSGLALDVYCRRHIFAPLGMHDTMFAPPRTLLDRIAPADIEGGVLRWGAVQDPMAFRMGGIAGHAGLFGTADDLVRFAQMILAGGTLRGHRILSGTSVRTATTPESPPGRPALRGFGWDIDSAYSTVLAAAFSPQSFGHTGYTGTALWIDPASRSFLIVLTSRLHPNGGGETRRLIRRIAGIVGAAAAGGGRRVFTGIDVLEAEGFRGLWGRRVGLLTNIAGQDAAGRRTIDVLHQALGPGLRALFSPEHGLGADLERQIPSGTDAATGLPVYSLYGETPRPTDAMLEGLDALVIDLQDAGARFYTYATTMAYVIEAASRNGLEVFVLDRPNPVTADIVQGPVLNPALVSFVGYMPMPIRHGMTMGELARMFNEERKLDAKLHVVEMRYYDRRSWFDETGLRWVAPSPNLRHLEGVTLYPGVALLEGAEISVGRGTPTPFELVGAPWIDGAVLSAALEQRAIPGVRFQPAEFTPNASEYAGVACGGIRIVVLNRRALDSPRLGIELIAAILRLYPGKFDLERILAMVGSTEVLDALRSGRDPKEIAQLWQPQLAAFSDVRENYLQY